MFFLNPLLINYLVQHHIIYYVEKTNLYYAFNYVNEFVYDLMGRKGRKFLKIEREIHF